MRLKHNRNDSFRKLNLAIQMAACDMERKRLIQEHQNQEASMSESARAPVRREPPKRWWKCIPKKHRIGLISLISFFVLFNILMFILRIAEK